MENKDRKSITDALLSYKGWIELTNRSGKFDKMDSEILYSSSMPYAYKAYIKLIGGFEKSKIITRSEMIDYTKKHVANLNDHQSPWVNHFETMAQMRVLKLLLYETRNYWTTEENHGTDTEESERND